MSSISLFGALLAALLVASAVADSLPKEDAKAFPYNFVKASQTIFDYVNTSGINFDTLEYICDTFGPRYRGKSPFFRLESSLLSSELCSAPLPPG